MKKWQMKYLEKIDGWSEFCTFFVPAGTTAAENKRLLSEMADRGEDKPRQTHPLGRALVSYTNKKSDCYDSVFHTSMLKKVPHWFIKTSDVKRQQLLEMADRKEPRPVQSKHPLGVALVMYTNPKNKCFNAAFNKEIRRRAPFWFVVDQTKKKLLRMAKLGRKKPSHKTSLGRSLRSYINEKGQSYDPEFKEQIKKIAPSWLLRENDSAAKKEELLKLARNKQPKPPLSTALGRALKHYTRPTSGAYDPEFDKLIRKLAPHWFNRSKKAA